MSIHPYGLGYVRRAIRAAEAQREEQERWKRIVVEIRPYVAGVTSPMHRVNTRMTVAQVEERIADAKKYPHACSPGDLEFLLKLKETVRKNS